MCEEGVGLKVDIFGLRTGMRQWVILAKVQVLTEELVSGKENTKASELNV